MPPDFYIWSINLIYMKTSTQLLMGILCIFLLHSCAPVYKCGEAKPEKVGGSKRLQAVVLERDILCTELASERSKNATLSSENEKQKQEIATRTKEQADLKKRYDD